MQSLNRVYLVGTLGKPPTLMNGRNGKPFCRLSVATDNTWSVDDEEKKTTDWHTVHVFGKQAELSAQYLDTGRHVLVEGKMFSQAIGDGEKKVWRSWVNADRVTFLGGGKRREADSRSDERREDAGDIPSFAGDVH